MSLQKSSFAVLFLLFSSPFALAQVKGTLDLRTTDLTQKRVPLSATWYHFDSQLLKPGEPLSGATFSHFPELWNDSKNSGRGYATYMLQVLLAPHTGQLSVQIPQLYSSYQLWADGTPVASNGIVGTSLETSVPQWLPQTALLENKDDTLTLILQISNFDHFKGGAKDQLYIGSSQVLDDDRTLAVKANLAETIVLTAFGLCFLAIYFVMERKKVIMYFALLCVTWGLRVGFSNLYIFVGYIPDLDWNWLVRIEYISLFLTMIWAILFLGKLFPKEENKILKYLLVGSNIAFTGFTLMTSPLAFTQWLPVYMAFCFILLFYGAAIVVKGWINQRTGASYLTLSVFLGVLMFSYDLFSYDGLFSYNALVFSIGYIMMFTLMSLVLLLHLNIVKSQQKSITKLTYKDLYK